MNRKRLIIIILVVLALILISLAVWFYLQKRSVKVVERPTEQTENLVIDKVTEDKLKQLPPPSADTLIDEQNFTLGLKQLAWTYAEIFGSYSNHANFKGWRDLKDLSTVKMQRYIDDIIGTGFNNIEIYEGYDTKALSSDLQNIDNVNAQATVLVKTQRVHSLTGQAERVFYQDILLQFVRINNEWKVNGAWWQ